MDNPGAHMAGARRASFVKELREDFREITDDAWQVVTHPRRYALRFNFFILWCVGALLDSISTQLMMFFGYEEQNPVAAAGMSTAGREVYVLVVTAVFFGLAFLASAKPRSAFAWTVVLCSTIACVVKLWTGVGNFIYWMHT